MADLPPPIEFLELAPGESRSFTIVSAEEGTTTIKPASAPQGKSIPVMRIHLQPESKLAPPFYYDISGTTLAAQLRPLVTQASWLPHRVTVTKVGSGPSARFTLEVAPAQVSSTP